MRVIVMIKATRQSEAGALPSQQLLEDMGRYNEALATARPRTRPAARRSTSCLPHRKKPTASSTR